jgi:hypothetical protein
MTYDAEILRIKEAAAMTYRFAHRQVATAARDLATEEASR